MVSPIHPAQAFPPSPKRMRPPSSTLSHLFIQGLNSADRLLADDELREQARDVIEGEDHTSSISSRSRAQIRPITTSGSSSSRAGNERRRSHCRSSVS